MAIRIEQLQLSRIASFLLGTRRLHEIADSIGADVIHCHGLRADILAAHSGLNCRKVSTIHSDFRCDYQSSHGLLQGTIMANREYAALRRFDAVVAISEMAAERAAKFAVRTEVIVSGVDLRIYAPPSSSEEVRRIRTLLSWPQDRPIILHTGTLRTLKRPAEVIAAFQDSVLARNALLVFAGDGPLVARCKQAARGSKNIAFIGHRSDLPDLLRGADAVVSNSTSEGLGMALLEACACGLRVIASDIEAHRYIAGLFPEQVTLFPVGDDSALTDGFNALSQSGRIGPTLPPAASLQAISAERMSRQYQDLYDRVLAGSPALSN